ncbi:hypothetical protein MC378_15305 [Polaribacter sp. MSW13]|uniref:YD repeat-containing protein n=1 Tax=Polaribacter marinus TaxID=2916838 RepID=A0A9X1VT39_9FLAO|nr:hypothetical protein [Polaribacter marinus]MCI2230542.1 hypothetical protein [Polaribacter marinus]
MRLTILIATFLLSQLTFSQSIASYNSNATKYEKNANFAQIIEKTSFYNSDGIKTEIEHKDFNKSMQLTSLKRFDDKNKLIWLNIYKYDSLQRRVRLDNKRWINIIGYQTKQTEYKYDSIGNFVQIDYNSQKQISNIAQYFLDKEKNLIRLENFNGNGSLIGYETANYDLENNVVVVNQYNNKNELVNSNNRAISHSGEKKQKTSNKYNEQGDLIFYKRNWNDNDNVCYTIEYKYDKKGNWISKKRYSHIQTENGKLKKKKTKMVKTRKIKYRE